MFQIITTVTEQKTPKILMFQSLLFEDCCTPPETSPYFNIQEPYKLAFDQA